MVAEEKGDTPVNVLAEMAIGKVDVAALNILRFSRLLGRHLVEVCLLDAALQRVYAGIKCILRSHVESLIPGDILKLILCHVSLI